jgi:hypothetical protein
MNSGAQLAVETPYTTDVSGAAAQLPQTGGAMLAAEVPSGQVLLGAPLRFHQVKYCLARREDSAPVSSVPSLLSSRPSTGPGRLSPYAARLSTGDRER